MSDDGRTPDEGDPRNPLDEEIFAEEARLGPNDTFNFRCHPGVSCFNTCCADVNIFLSPYDVLRLTERLGISSTEFLEKYTLLPVQKDMNTPVVLLKMSEDEAKSCQFLTEEGCGVYTDRPWPCRMYPIGLATSRDTEDGWQGRAVLLPLQGIHLPGSPGSPGTDGSGVDGRTGSRRLRRVGGGLQGTGTPQVLRRLRPPPALQDGDVLQRHLRPPEVPGVRVRQHAPGALRRGRGLHPPDADQQRGPPPLRIPVDPLRRFR